MSAKPEGWPKKRTRFVAERRESRRRGVYWVVVKYIHNPYRDDWEERSLTGDARYVRFDSEDDAKAAALLEAMK